jgi:hypothetical protein
VCPTTSANVRGLSFMVGREWGYLEFNPSSNTWKMARPVVPSHRRGITFYPDPGPNRYNWNPPPTQFVRPNVSPTASVATRTVRIRNEMDQAVSFVVQSDAVNVTAFSQSGAVGGKATTTIQVPDDVNSVKYILTRGSENTGWVHTFF